MRGIGIHGAGLLHPTMVVQPPSGGQIITFVDGYGGDVFTQKDNLLNSAAPFLNLGTHVNFEVSPSQNCILQFDLSSIPSTAICISATLYMYRSYPYGDGGGDPLVKVYSIAAANHPWVAGIGSLDPALLGETCWGARECDGAGGIQTAWAGSAGCNTSGVDYEATMLGSFTWHAVTTAQGFEFVVPLTVARIQNWFGMTNTNYGLFLKTSGGGDHLAQSNHATVAYRPKLVITYRP